MTCNDCEGSGDSANKGQACFHCGGTGELCDGCGESCEGGTCNACLSEQIESESTDPVLPEDDLDYGP